MAVVDRVSLERERAETRRDADLGNLDRTLQLIGQGGVGLLVGVTLALTGPSTPSFALLAALPGWPLLYGFVHGLIASTLLLSRLRREESWVGSLALVLMGAGYAIVGLILWWTWLSWHAEGELGSEPLLTAVPICLGLATHCGYLAVILTLRRRRARARASG